MASELRDRIRNSGVEIRVVDRTARAEFKVEPRQFEGRLLHELRPFAQGDLYLELYLARPESDNVVGLYRQGTRVLENLAALSDFTRTPWTSGYLQGILDVPYLNLTPGTRNGIIQDEAYQRLTQELAPLESQLLRIIEEQRQAEEEQMSREVLRSVQKALKEALLILPAEEYDWFNLHQGGIKRPKPPETQQAANGSAMELKDEARNEQVDEPESPQKDFFEYAGPLFSVRISPASSILPVAGTKTLRAIARDRANRLVEQGLVFRWSIVEGEGALENADGEIVTYKAPAEPGLIKLRLVTKQGDIECAAEALITVTDSIIPENQAKDATKQGIPGYTFQKAPGELWRSRYQPEQNVVVINNGHRDFVFASRNKSLKLRYICRLFAKELVMKNFTGVQPAELLERLIELSLYTEENLK